MSSYTFRSSKPDHWVSPRPAINPALRAQAYGRIRPMHEPSWHERIFG